MLHDGRHFPRQGRGRGRTVLAIGIDNLGTLEELFGEEIGDELMAAIGRRLADAVPIGAGLCATRHRRFLLDLPGLEEGSAAALFGRLQAVAAAGAIATGAGSVAVTLSAGCAFQAEGTGRSEMAERAALRALHGAMAGTVGAFRVARDERVLLQDRERLRDASRLAIAALGAAAGDEGDEGAGGDASRLALAFQPVVRASGGHTIGFHECLVRICRPDGGVLAAGDFMPELERLGLAPLIDRQVLAMTFDALARHPGVRLSVNVFPQTMQDARWMALFDRAVARDPTLAERLIVELTETCSVLDPGRTLAFMDRLRRQGVAFALDDFGAGHTSLGYLRDFRFDIVKVDGRFVRGITPGSDNAFFVSKVVEIARRFEMMTVAEAVQGPEEARCLADSGIDAFQGFWFGCPSLVLEPTPAPMPAVAAQA